MSLLNKIKTDLLVARKDRDNAKTSMLTYILGQVTRDPQTPATDSLILATLKATHKQMSKTAEFSLSENARALLDSDLAILEGLMPEKKTSDELVDLIGMVIGTFDRPNMGNIMKNLAILAEQQGFTYDGKEASGVIKELL